MYRGCLRSLLKLFYRVHFQGCQFSLALFNKDFLKLINSLKYTSRTMIMNVCTPLPIWTISFSNVKYHFDRCRAFPAYVRSTER